MCRVMPLIDPEQYYLDYPTKNVLIKAIVTIDKFWHLVYNIIVTSIADEQSCSAANGKKNLCGVED